MTVLDTNLYLAVRCPDCGKIKFHNVSTFKLPEDSRIDLYCECGSIEMTLRLKDNRAIVADVPCLACDVNHTYIYNLKDILKRRVTMICCRETGLELCFMGSEKDVKDVVLRYQEDINMLLGELGLLVDAEEDVLKKIIHKIT